MENFKSELTSLLSNKIVVGLGIVVITCFICTSHTTRDSFNPIQDKVIQVTGSSEMSITPDEIEFVIGINENYESSFTKKVGDHKAITNLNKVENEVKAKLEELGVKKETIKTELNVSSYWYWNDNRQTNLTKQLTFCVNDFSIINEFVNETDIKGLQYMRMGKLSHKKILDYRKQVKIDALKAAKEKASYLLESIGKKAGDIINITELPEKSNDGWGYYYPQYYSNSNMLSNSSSYGGSQDGGANSEIRSIKLRYEVQSVFDIVE